MPWPPTEAQWQAYLERERLERKAKRRHDWIEAGQVLLAIAGIFLFLGFLMTLDNRVGALILLMVAVGLVVLSWRYRPR